MPGKNHVAKIVIKSELFILKVNCWNYNPHSVYWQRRCRSGLRLLTILMTNQICQSGLG